MDGAEDRKPEMDGAGDETDGRENDELNPEVEREEPAACATLAAISAAAIATHRQDLTITPPRFS